MNVAFLNENTLGHGSYLPRFVEAFRERPELGIVPHRIDVVPFPEPMRRKAEFTVRGLRRIGLDFHLARWRRVASRHARALVDDVRRRHPIDALVVNTQSVGLDLIGPDLALPVFVGLDATFRQLARSPWFAGNRVARALLPLTLAPILGRERRLVRGAHRLLAWSAAARDSLVHEYGIDPSRVGVLPPSLDLRQLSPGPRPGPTPGDPEGGESRKAPGGRGERWQILFVGGHFERKGGPALLEAFRREWVSEAELHLVTQSEVKPEPGVQVHRGLTASSEAWLERWRQARVFVFPSTLETFGIVLLEALAFGVPVVSSRAGAAGEILEDGRCGRLLDVVTPGSVSAAIRAAISDPCETRLQRERGLARVRGHYDLARNAEALAEWLRQGRMPSR